MTLDRKTPPVIYDAVDFNYVLPPINAEQLKNSIPFYWLNAGVQDVVEIDWVFPAGLWYEEKEAISQAVAGQMKNGTSKRTAQEINEALEFYGANLKVSPGNDYSTISLYTLTKHLPKLLPIVFEVMTDAIFPQHELDLYKQNSLQRLMVSLRQCDFVANQKIDAALFGENHPYGRYSKKEKIEAITREDLASFYKKHYNLSDVKIFMAGKVGAAEVQCLNEVFGSVATVSSANGQLSFAIENSADKKQFITNDAEGVQGAIRMAKHFPNRHHPDFAPMIVLNTLYGGYFGSRLMSNIREEKGYTYGIHSSLTSYKHGGSLGIYTEVGKDVIEPALKEIYKEMELLCNEPAEEEELLLVKNYLLGNLLGDLDGPFSILQRWRTLLLNDLTIEHFNRNISIYKAITAKELQALAQKYFTFDDFYEIVVV